MKKINIKSGLCGFMAVVTAMCCVPTVAKNIETSINLMLLSEISKFMLMAIL